MKIWLEYEENGTKYAIGILKLLTLLGVTKTEAEVVAAVKKALLSQ